MLARPRVPCKSRAVYLTSTVATPSNFFRMASASSLVAFSFKSLRSAVHQVLGFLQTEGGHFAYSLDGVDLIGAGILQNDLKFGLFLGRRSCSAAASRCHCHRGRAAAETPSRSSSFFTRAAASSRLRLTICSSNCAISAMFFSNQKSFEFVFIAYALVPKAAPRSGFRCARPAPHPLAVQPKP